MSKKSYHRQHPIVRPELRLQLELERLLWQLQVELRHVHEDIRQEVDLVGRRRSWWHMVGSGRS